MPAECSAKYLSELSLEALSLLVGGGKHSSIEPKLWHICLRPSKVQLAALLLLLSQVHLQALPYCFIDVRPAEEAAAAPLAAWVAPAVNIPGELMQLIVAAAAAAAAGRWMRDSSRDG